MPFDSELDLNLERLDDYGLAHLFSHLYSLRETRKYRQEIYALICQSFMRLKLERTQSPDSFVQDVSIAIEVASSEEPPNLVQLARLSLIEATLVAITENVPVEVLGALAYLGEIKRAKGYTALLPGRMRQFQASCLIADALLSKGMKRDALDELEKARTVLDEVADEELQRSAQGILMKAMVSAGAEFDQIMGNIKAFGEPWNQVKTLNTIAELYASQGSPKLAATAAKEALFFSKNIQPAFDLRRIDSIHAREESWSHLTTTFSVTGTKTERTFDWERAEALYEISLVFAKIGDYDEALKILATIGNKASNASFVNFWEDAYPEVLGQWYRVRALGAIAVLLIQHDQKDLGKQVAQEAFVTANRIKKILSSKVSRWGTGTGDPRWSLRDEIPGFGGWGAEDNTTVWPMFDALSIAAVALAEAGDTTRSHKTVTELEASLMGFNTMSVKIAGTRIEWSLIDTLLTVSRAFLTLEDLESAKRNALLVFRNIKDGGKFIEAEQAQNLIRLVPLLDMLKINEKTIIEMVIEVVNANKTEGKRMYELLEITKSLYEHGYESLGSQLLIQTSEAAQRVRNKRLQLEMKGKIAILLATNNQSSEASRLVDEVMADVNLREESMKYTEMCRIAQGMAGAGMLEEALDVVKQVKKVSRRFSTSLDRIKIHSLIAQSLVKLNRHQEAAELADDTLKVAERLKIYWQKAEALSAVIPAFATLGAKAQGRKIATQALKAAKRLKGQQKVEALRKVISGMVSTGDFVRAKSIPDLMTSKKDKVTLSMILVHELLSAGMTELSQNVTLNALDLAKGISKPADRLLALSHISAELAATGLLTESRETFDSIIAKVRRVSNEQVRFNSIGHLSISLAYTGDVSGSLSLAESIQDERMRSWTLSEISTILARSGKQKESLEVFASTFTANRHATRENVFGLIGSHSFFLADLDQGQTLWQIYQAVQDTEGWWGQELFGSATH